MHNLRRAEAVSGVSTTVLALATLGYLLLGPTYSFVSSTGSKGTASLIQVWQQAHIQPVTLIAFCLLLFSILGVAIGSVGHSRTRKQRWQQVLITSVSIMVLFTLIALLSVGPLIAPATLLALLTLFFSARLKNSEA